ncbi:hypothetical protein DNTS_033980 [Danionella cerebrum]|uniref:PiggyBac transposable element-derived protein domain-containing protein n=1 Tax=Danionella cerebrum TaxID=2873325 RepID=A0A553PEJ3_9TELE|nr:hypothetical protein DNTS_033980 [Danionella translucida]
MMLSPMEEQVRIVMSLGLFKVRLTLSQRVILSSPLDEEAVALNSPSVEIRETAKDGTVWTVVEQSENRGRLQSQNVMTEAAGPTAHAKRNIEDALTAFLCLVDDGMLKHIRDCTVAEAHRVKEDSSWDLTVNELKAFIALVYVRGAQGGKGMGLASFWSADWGYAFFKETMSRNRFQEIMRFLRFDKKETRCTRVQVNKFALVADVWEKLIQNSIACYKPGADITVDEQLFPTKARCRFIQYIASKPDKFGIKFWLAADVNTKYMVNGAPYLGKDETRMPGQRLGDSVVLKMVEPYLGKGRNITTDNFFTSLELAKALQAKKTSLVGTVNNTRRELPPRVKEQRPLFTTQECTNETTSRRNFIMRLANKLRSDHMRAKATQLMMREPGPWHEQQQMERRRQCQVRRNCKKNKTKDTCDKCQKVVCGSCTWKVEITCVDCE